MELEEYPRCKTCAHHFHGDVTRVMKCDHPNPANDEAIIFVSPNDFCAWHTPIKRECRVCASGKNRVMI